MTPLQSMNAHGGVVRVAARKLAHQSGGRLDAQDLEQDGLMALLQMNLDTGASESETAAYVSQRARGAMLDAERVQDICPRSVRSKARAIAIAKRRLEQRLGRRPRDAEIAEAANLDLDEYFSISTAPLSGAPAGELDDIAPLDQSYCEQHTASHTSDPLELFIRAELQRGVARAIATLTARQRNALLAMYIDGQPGSVTGAQMGVTESRVCQIRKVAIKRIRESLREQGFI
jgi:RNA polymerase sigma factor for flagellar operon FliA